MFDGVAGITAVTLTANRTAAAPPIPIVAVEPHRHGERVTGGDLDRPGGELGGAASGPRRGSRKIARPRRTRISASLRHRREPGDPARPRSADERRCERDRDQQQRRREADQEQVLGAAVEEVGRADDDDPEQHQGEDVERRLRDQGAEQDRERLPEPADPAGDDHRPGGLAEAGRQRRRHQHPDHRRRGEVAAAQDRGGERRAGGQIPGRRAEEHRSAHERRRRPAPRPRSERTALSTTLSKPIRCAAR